MSLLNDITSGASYVNKILELIAHKWYGPVDIDYFIPYIKYKGLKPKEIVATMDPQTVECVLVKFFKRIGDLTVEDFEDFLKMTRADQHRKKIFPAYIDWSELSENLSLTGYFYFLLFAVLYNDKWLFDKCIMTFNKQLQDPHKLSNQYLDFDEITKEEASSALKNVFNYFPAGTENLIDTYVKPYEVM